MDEGGQTGGQIVAEDVRRKCGENAEKVFQAISANYFIKTHEIADQTQRSQRTVDNAILKLRISQARWP